MPSLPDFEEERSTYDGKTKSVFWLGHGPAVLIIPEIPGITPSVAAFGRRIADAGFTVAVPSIFGEPGRAPTPFYLARSLVRACVSKELTAFARSSTSPITVWLRALARDAYARCGGRGVGVVGMCFTGGFALALAVDPHVTAPVVSQPSLPLPITKSRYGDLGVDAADLAQIERRVREEGLEVMGLRFTHDKICRPERFERLREELGDGFIGIEIDSSPGNPHGHRDNAHSVLTEEYVDTPGSPTRRALDAVIEHLRSRIGGAVRP